VLDLPAIALTTLHFITANVAVGGPFLALWLYRRAGRRNDAAADMLGRQVLRVSLITLYVATAAGALAAYVWWNSAPTAVARAFRALPRSRYEFGVAELIISAVCYEVWLRMWRKQSPRRTLAWWVGLFGATNVAYHFPTLFTMLSVLSTRPLDAGTELRFVALLGDREVLARITHFMLASLAVSGAVLMWLAAAMKINDPDREAARQRLQTSGARLALVPTLMQWPVGILVLLTLPDASRDALLGDDVPTAAMFGLSLATVVALMHALAVPAFGRATRREVSLALVWLGITIVLMTAVRQYARKPFYPAATEQARSVVVAHSLS
jgi:hypothetical protein